MIGVAEGRACSWASATFCRRSRFRFSLRHRRPAGWTTKVGPSARCRLVFSRAGCCFQSAITRSHLAYFNELAGGPLGGREHLLDSNLDWGQNLGGLKHIPRRPGSGRNRTGLFRHRAAEGAVASLPYSAAGNSTAGPLRGQRQFRAGTPLLGPHAPERDSPGGHRRTSRIFASFEPVARSVTQSTSSSSSRTIFPAGKPPSAASGQGRRVGQARKASRPTFCGSEVVGDGGPALATREAWVPGACPTLRSQAALTRGLRAFGTRR